MAFTIPGSSGSTGVNINFNSISNGQTWNPGAMIGSSIKRAVEWNTRPSNLFAGILTQIEMLKAFDWNATDNEIRTMLKSAQVSAAAAWGGAIGQGIGRIAGLGIGAGLQVHLPVLSASEINRVVAEKMMDDLKEDAADEVLGEVAQAVKQTVFLGLNTVALEAYLKIRSTLKAMPEPALSAIAGKETASWIKRGWGTENAPVLSFNAAVESQIEKIKPPALQAFTEELLEEAWSGFIESGFIIANSLDEAYANARMSQLASQGSNRTITLIPDENAPNEQYILEEAPQEEVIQQANTLLNQYRTLRNRSVGTIVAHEINETVGAMPQLRRLEIEYRSVPQPPWINSDRSQAAPTFIRIPNPKQGITRNQLKLAAKPYTFGQFCTTVHFTDRRKLRIFTSTASEGRERAEQLADLSASRILRITGNQVFEQDLNLRQDIQSRYAAFARLMFRQNISNSQTLDVVTAETVSTEYKEITLWSDNDIPGEATIF